MLNTAKVARPRPVTYILFQIQAGIIAFETLTLLLMYLGDHMLLLVIPALLFYFLSSLCMLVSFILPYFLTAAIVFDVVTKRLPRAILIVPVAAFTAYYFFYFPDSIAVKNIQNQLQAQNPTQIMAYDSGRQEIVMPSYNDDFVSRFKVPVIYERNYGVAEGYLARRLVTSTLCDKFSVLRIAMGYCFPVLERQNSYDPTRMSTSREQLQLPEAPTKETIDIMASQKELNINEMPVSEVVNEFKYKGQDIGKFVQASAERLPPLPVILYGVMLPTPGSNIQETPGPYVKFWRYQVELDTFPPSIDQEKYDHNLIAAMLNIEKRSEDDLEHFVDYPESVTLVDNLLASKQNKKP